MTLTEILYILIGGRVKQAQPFKGFGSFDLGGEFIHGSNTVVNKLALDNGWPILPVSTTYVPVTLTASVSWCHNLTEGDTSGRSRVNFLWVCATGLSEPLPHYSLYFCDQ